MSRRSVTVVNNATILKNRGFKVRVCKLQQTEGGSFVRIVDEDGVPETHERWFKFTNLELATMEEPVPLGWGGLDPWGEALEAAPFNTVAKTFAVVFDMFRVNPQTGKTEPDVRAGALMMEDGAVAQYAAVMMACLQMSQGVDPEACGEMASSALDEADQDVLKMTEDMRKALREFKAKRSEAADDTQTSPNSVSPGADSLPDGQQSIEAGTSSGA